MFAGNGRQPVKAHPPWSSYTAFLQLQVRESVADKCVGEVMDDQLGYPPAAVAMLGGKPYGRPRE